MDALTILADVGEDRSGVPNALRALGVEVVVTTLAAGDYAVGHDVLVERKSIHDLHRSIATGRLWSQMEKLRSSAGRAWLLVEGPCLDRGPISPAGVRAPSSPSWTREYRCFGRGLRRSRPSGSHGLVLDVARTQLARHG